MLNTIAILIPAYNPGEPLIDLVASLSEDGFRKIVIVDDGSKDSSVFDQTSMRAPVHVTVFCKIVVTLFSIFYAALRAACTDLSGFKFTSLICCQCLTRPDQRSGFLALACS